MKKIVGVYLVLILALQVFCVPVLAVSPIITGHSDGHLEDNFAIGHSGDFSGLRVEPGDELKIPITAGMFSWSDGVERPENGAIDSLFRLYNSRIKLSYKKLAGSNVLDYVQLELGTFDYSFRKFDDSGNTRRTAFIKVKFTDDFNDINDKYFRYVLYLSIDGVRYEELTLELTGEYIFDVEYADSFHTEHDLSDGAIIEAEETVPLAKFDLGAGVIVQKNLNKGQRYYGQAYINDSVDDVREDWPELYPDVEIIYQIMAKNLDNGISKAVLTPPNGKTYYVYNKEMDFVGMTGDTVPYSDIFFLSTTQIPAFELGSYEEALPRVPTSDPA